jgi:DNA (cytosine-5)-methyltransferase 1
MALIRDMTSPTYGSLFSGAGGMDLGFDRAGESCSWQVEIDSDCQNVLARHWPAVPRHGDIRDVQPRDLDPFDVIVGGFPCQDISMAGKRTGLHGERSGLFWEMRMDRKIRI